MCVCVCALQVVKKSANEHPPSPTWAEGGCDGARKNNGYIKVTEEENVTWSYHNQTTGSL